MTLYASQAGPRTSSDLYTIDPLTGVATSIATMSVALTGMAMDPTTGVMYGVTSNNSTDPLRLVTVDLVTGATTIIGQLLDGATVINCADIAFDSSGQLYGWNETNDRLASINKATGRCVRFGTTNWSTQGDGMDFDWQDNLFGIFKGDDVSLYQIKSTVTTPLIPGVELAAGAGPDDLDETYGQTTRKVSNSNLTTIAALHGDGYPVSAGAMQGDKFYIIVNQFGSPVFLATVDYYGFITTIGQTLDGIDALATDDPGGRSNWYGPSPYPFVESWEDAASINTDKWSVYRRYGSSPISPNQKRTLTRLIPGLDDQDETLDSTLEGVSWFSITDAESVLGTHSIFLDYKHPTETLFDVQQLVHWDELGGGANDIEYWMAYQFMIADWTVLYNSDSAQVELPDFRTNSNHVWSTTTAIGNYLFPDDPTHGSFWDWDGNDHEISAGDWHELRIGYMRRSSDNKVVVTQYLDGELIVDHSVSFGSGSRVYGIQWNSQFYYNTGYYPTEPPESLVYIDPIIWSTSDPGPITPFNLLRPDRINSSTVVYQPTLDPGNLDVPVDFIDTTGGTFDPYLSGLILIDAPFIGPTTTVFSPALLGPNPAHVSQDVVEVVFKPDSDARVSQDVVEVVLKPDSEARVSQDVVEVVVKGDSDARVSQDVVEVLIQTSHEEAIVIWIP